MTDSFPQKGGIVVNESGVVVRGANTISPPSETFVREDGSYAPYEFWMSLWDLRDLYAYGLDLLITREEERAI